MRRWLSFVIDLSLSSLLTVALQIMNQKNNPCAGRDSSVVIANQSFFVLFYCFVLFCFFLNIYFTFIYWFTICCYHDTNVPTVMTKGVRVRLWRRWLVFVASEWAVEPALPRDCARPPGLQWDEWAPLCQLQAGYGVFPPQSASKRKTPGVWIHPPDRRRGRFPRDDGINEYRNQ